MSSANFPLLCAAYCEPHILERHSKPFSMKQGSIDRNKILANCLLFTKLGINTASSSSTCPVTSKHCCEREAHQGIKQQVIVKGML